MKIRHIDGEKLYYAFLSGKKEVFRKRDHLNRINVFPVADGDTGTNLALTMQSIFDDVAIQSSVSDLGASMADAVLSGSRGNSGIIFAQFIRGISESIRGKHQLSPKDFSRAMRTGVEHAYQALSKPVEGTIITVMKAWANALYKFHEKTTDFGDLLNKARSAAKRSLAETPKKLKVLRDAGVVDAGAEGFVHFLEGISYFLRHGAKPEFSLEKTIQIADESDHVFTNDATIPYRYCTETMIKGQNLEISVIRSLAEQYGESLIVAGSGNRLKLHIHSNHPADLFFRLKECGTLVQQKVDDMQKQCAVQFHRQSAIALVVDSACDLPIEIMDRHQIHMIPLNSHFGETQYLDKLTLMPEQFYTMMESKNESPKTSQPSIKAFEQLYSYLLAHYDSVISMHLAGVLSGTYNTAKIAAEKCDPNRISVIDTKNLSTTFGLMVLNVAERIVRGDSRDEIVAFAESLPGKTKILVSVPTLKYMVRSGRVSPLKGVIANILNLTPIISLDPEGKSKLYGNALGMKSNIKKILNMIETFHQNSPVKQYAIGHAHANDEARKFEGRIQEIIGKKAEYIMEISPAIGIHAGIGAMSVSLLAE